MGANLLGNELELVRLVPEVGGGTNPTRYIMSKT